MLEDVGSFLSNFKGSRIALAAVPAARFSLVTEKRALTKFLKCVDWSDAQEAQQVGLVALSSQHVCMQHHRYMCVHRLAALPSQHGSTLADHC
jgi:hypothetical protein